MGFEELKIINYCVCGLLFFLFILFIVLNYKRNKIIYKCFIFIFLLCFCCSFALIFKIDSWNIDYNNALEKGLDKNYLQNNFRISFLESLRNKNKEMPEHQSEEALNVLKENNVRKASFIVYDYNDEQINELVEKINKTTKFNNYKNYFVCSSSDQGKEFISLLSNVYGVNLISSPTKIYIDDNFKDLIVEEL